MGDVEMKIGAVATRAGVTPKAVRYYESLGLVTPARLSNGYRDYGEHHVRLVREVRSLSQLGIPAERTRPFLDCLAAGREHADDCPASLATYRDAIAELTERIEGLAARRAVLVTQLREAAHRTRGAPTGEPERTIVTDLNQLPANLPEPEDDGAAITSGGRRPRTSACRAQPGEPSRSTRWDRAGPSCTSIR